jgi:uncharacterized membrane protein
MLVVFPLGLFVTAVVFDLIALVSDNPVSGQVGFWNIAAGVIGAVLAALTGLADWTAIPPASRAKQVGLIHGATNAGVVILFAIAWLVRRDNTDHAPSAAAFTLEVLGLAAGAFAAWLGGELVERHGIGVAPDADVNARSSLRS